MNVYFNVFTVVLMISMICVLWTMQNWPNKVQKYAYIQKEEDSPEEQSIFPAFSIQNKVLDDTISITVTNSITHTSRSQDSTLRDNCKLLLSQLYTSTQKKLGSTGRFGELINQIVHTQHISAIITNIVFERE